MRMPSTSGALTSVRCVWSKAVRISVATFDSVNSISLNWSRCVVFSSPAVNSASRYALQLFAVRYMSPSSA